MEVSVLLKFKYQNCIFWKDWYRCIPSCVFEYDFISERQGGIFLTQSVCHKLRLTSFTLKVPWQKLSFLGMQQYHSSQNGYDTDTWIKIITDTEYQCRYFYHANKCNNLEDMVLFPSLLDAQKWRWKIKHE